MSFSSDIKEELSKLNYWKDKKLIEQELAGFLITNNISTKKKKLKFVTENEYTINRFGKLLSNLGIDYEIEIQGNLFQISCKQLETIQEKPETEEEIKAFVRGAFLGGGSMNNPKRGYHLEIVFTSKEEANQVQKILTPYQIKGKELEKKNSFSWYLKDGEEISKLLALMGASSSVLKFEEIRVLKEMKNNVNRLVNCETANLNKTVGAAVRQMEAIEKIKKKGKIQELPDSLREIAELRIENPDCSLQELGQMLRQPIGKSGVNHRLQKIEQIAEGL